MTGKHRLLGNGDDIAIVASGESDNLAMAQRALGDTWLVAEQSQALFGKLAISMQVQVDPSRRELAQALPTFLLGAQRSALFGCLTVGRMHFQEADMLARRALELSAFAWIIWKDPDLIKVWVRADDGREAYSLYRAKFSAKAVHHALRELHSALPGDYDRLSRATHPTLHSLAASWEDAGNELRMNYIDLRDGSVPYLAALVLQHARSNIRCTDGLAKRLLTGQEWRPARRAWKQHYQPTAELFHREIQRWRGPYLTYVEGRKKTRTSRTDQRPPDIPPP